MTDKVDVVDIKAESDVECKLNTLAEEEDTPGFNEISETVALEEPKEEDKQDNPQEAIQEDADDVKNKEDPKKEDLKQLVTCPDCGIKLQLRGLKYTHKRYCKGKKTDAESKTPKANKVSQAADIEEPPAPAPIVEPIENTQKTVIPTHEQIATYLAQDRKMKAEKKRVRINNLINQAF